MAEFWQSLNSDSQSFLRHRFGDKWLTAQELYIDLNFHVGDLLVQIHCSERQELTR